MPSFFFYLFSLLAIGGAVALVCFRNPVSSALSMVGFFVGLAALFFGLNAYFVGIMQILVYAGAIMVLFIFIIMLLDLNNEEKVRFRSSSLAAGLVIPLVLVAQLVGLLGDTPDDANEFIAITPETLKASASVYQTGVNEAGEPVGGAIYNSLMHPTSPKLPDANLVGDSLFTQYNFPIQVMGVLLIVATIGTVVLSRRPSKAAPAATKAD